MRDSRDTRGPAGLRLLPGADETAVGVFIVAPYPSVRAGLRALVEQSPGLVVLADAPDELLETSLPPAAIVADVPPDDAGLPARLAARYPEAALILLLDGPAVWRRVTAGLERPVAALLKDAGAAEIGAAARAALQGLVGLDPAFAPEQAQPSSSYPRPGDELIEPLTERERQVLELLATGLPNKTIAAELGISEDTAKFHVGAIMSKLGAASRTEAVALAARRGLLVL